MGPTEFCETVITKRTDGLVAECDILQREFRALSVYDLEFSSREVICDAVGERVVLGKSSVVSASNQEVEAAHMVYVAGVTSQTIPDFTTFTMPRNLQSRGARRALPWEWIP